MGILKSLVNLGSRNEMNVSLMSNEYQVRQLLEEDVPAIYQLCSANHLYYEYCPPFVTEKGIKEDMVALPPHTTMQDKYFIGFYDANKLIAVLDLISGYPKPSIAFIGFFMTDTSVQGKGIGSKIIAYLCDYLKAQNYQTVQLAWVKGNPQAEHFWLKNGFVKFKEKSSTAADCVILAERVLK